jgi:hypothetical protein
MHWPVLRVLSEPKYSQAPRTSRVCYSPLRYNYTSTSWVHVFNTRLLIPVGVCLDWCAANEHSSITFSLLVKDDRCSETKRETRIDTHFVFRSSIVVLGLYVFVDEVSNVDRVRTICNKSWVSILVLAMPS